MYVERSPRPGMGAGLAPRRAPPRVETPAHRARLAGLRRRSPAAAPHDRRRDRFGAADPAASSAGRRLCGRGPAPDPARPHPGHPGRARASARPGHGHGAAPARLSGHRRRGGAALATERARRVALAALADPGEKGRVALLRGLMDRELDFAVAEVVHLLDSGEMTPPSVLPQRACRYVVRLGGAAGADAVAALLSGPHRDYAAQVLAEVQDSRALDRLLERWRNKTAPARGCWSAPRRPGNRSSRRAGRRPCRRPGRCPRSRGSRT